jgi:hypothetical protein
MVCRCVPPQKNCVLAPPIFRSGALQGLGEINCLDKILRSKKKSALTGPVSQLKAIKDALLRYIFELRER